MSNTSTPVPQDRRRKLTKEQTQEIKNQVAAETFTTFTALAREYGVTRQAIRYVLHPERRAPYVPRAPRTDLERMRERIRVRKHKRVLKGVQ
jgi:hypothetical protein